MSQTAAAPCFMDQQGAGSLGASRHIGIEAVGGGHFLGLGVVFRGVTGLIMGPFVPISQGLHEFNR